MKNIEKYMDFDENPLIFMTFPDFPATSGKYEIHPPKFCAGLVPTSSLRFDVCTVPAVFRFYPEQLARDCYLRGSRKRPFPRRERRLDFQEYSTHFQTL